MHSYLDILPVLSAISCLSLGLFTLLRNRRHPSNIGFALGMGSLVIVETGSTMLLLGVGYDRMFSAGLKVYLCGQAFLPAAWLLFTSVFARSNPRDAISRKYRVLTAMCVISAAFTALILADGFYHRPVASFGDGYSLFSDGQSMVYLGPIGQYLYIYVIVGTVFNLVQIENTLRSSSGTKRWQIKYVIFGVASILGYFIYISSYRLLFSALSFQNIHIGSAIIIVSTMIMAVFIVKQRLLDVDIFISRYVVYNSFTVMIVGLYLLALGILYYKVPYDYFFTAFFTFLTILALFILLFMENLRRKIQLFINKHFYKHKYEFRDKWMETIEKISRKSSVDDILATLRDMVSETTGAKPVYLWTYDQVTRTYQTKQKAVDEPLRRIPADSSFVRRLKKYNAPFTVEDISDGATDSEALAVMFSDTGTVLCAPLVTDQQVIGFIMQGPDRSNEPYVQDDFEILTAMTTQAAVQIKNITMALELMAAKEVDTFNRLSTFIMHDLKNLTNSLSLISQNAQYNMDNPEFQKDTIKTIEGTVSRMKNLIERLSSVPKGMELKMVETDVKSFITEILRKIRLPEDKKVVITSGADFMPPFYIDREAVEMVLINLIINAYDSIDTNGVIKINANYCSESVNIMVSDNGSGMTGEFIDTSLFRPFKTTKRNGFGIGLYQCKTLIEAHGGTISVESTPGTGTRFTVTLPAKASPRLAIRSS